MAKRVGESPPLIFIAAYVKRSAKEMAKVVDAAYTVIFGMELVVRVLGSGPGFFYRPSAVCGMKK